MTDKIEIKPPRLIDVELKTAQDKLHNAIWGEDEELQSALRRQIERLEFLKAMGERYDVNH